MYFHTYSRDTRSLSGTWSAVPDPYGSFGEGGEWGGDGIFEPDYGEGSFPADADIDDGYEMAVPGCWNAEHEQFTHYEDVMWYGRRFEWNGESERAFLRFGAVNYAATVYLNGERVGHHEGGFTPFAVEVTEEIEERPDNLLVVEIDGSREDRTLPTPTTDWFNFGGITREVELVGVPRAFVRNAKVETAFEGDEAVVSVTAWVDGDPNGDAMSASLPGLGASWELAREDEWESDPDAGAPPAEGVRFQGECAIPEDDVERWHPESPVLYDLTVSLGDDTLGERIGFRTVSVSGSDVLVNGEPVDLRGISLHEEQAGKGRALDDADREERFAWIDELNANFARLAHYPHHRGMARTADEKGVLLWEEVPAYWSVSFGEANVQKNYRQQLRELVQRDWNRPSVALWGIANETDHTDDDRNEVLPAMADYVRDLDDSRLVTAACFMEETEDGYTVSDPLVDSLDVFGINQYQGWYGGEADDFADFESDPEGPPIVISEVGAGAKRGNHGPASERWTEEFQAALYHEQTEAVASVEQVAGMTPWILFDFRSPRRQNPHQRGYNLKGLRDRNGEKKAAFDVLKRHYER